MIVRVKSHEKCGYDLTMIRLNGPKIPKWPLKLIHPLGPIFRHIPISLRRHILYFHAYKRWGNFRDPHLFSEKMQWRILNDRRPLIGWTCDKLASKEYARKTTEIAGVNLRIPKTYWAGTDIEELKLASSSFPARWVLKPNHSCGRLRVVDSSVAPIDWQDLENVVKTWVERDEEELVLGHWAYGQAQHVVIVEEYVEHDSNSITDYKLVGFGGKIEIIVASSDATNIREPLRRYDRDFNVHPSATGNTGNQASSAIDELSESGRRDLVTIAELLIAPFDQMRVDLYAVSGQIWFGEFSAYHSSGLRSPGGIRLSAESDARRGALWPLPNLSAADAREGEWRALLR